MSRASGTERARLSSLVTARMSPGRQAARASRRPGRWRWVPVMPRRSPIGTSVRPSDEKACNCRRVMPCSLHSFAAAPEPLWAAIPKAVGPAVTALVALTLAVAGYFKFIRGRIFQPRLTLELVGRAVPMWEDTALLVQVCIRNDGQSGVVLDPRFAQSLDVFLADRPVREDAVNDPGGVVFWYDGRAPHRRVDVLLEPGLLGLDVAVFRSDPDDPRDSASDVRLTRSGPGVCGMVPCWNPVSRRAARCCFGR